MAHENTIALYINKMMDHRGYQLSNAEFGVDASVLEASNLYLHGCFENPETHSVCVVFRFLGQEKMGVNVLRTICDSLENKNVARVVVVSSLGLTPFAAKELELSEFSDMFQFFLDAEMMFCPIDCHLVPKHRRVSKTELENLEKQFGSAKNFPKLQQNDRIARHYDFVPGEIVEITRSWGEIQSLVYRIVE